MKELSVVPAGEAEARLWRTTLELCRLFADWPWVVIGAQMVIILELEAGQPAHHVGWPSPHRLRASLLARTTASPVRYTRPFRMTYRHLEIVRQYVVRRPFASLRHPEVARRES